MGRHKTDTTTKFAVIKKKNIIGQKIQLKDNFVLQLLMKINKIHKKEIFSS